MSTEYDEHDRDAWGQRNGPFGERDFHPRHLAITLYHKETSEDGVTIFDPNAVGAGKSAWLTARSGVAIARPNTR